MADFHPLTVSVPRRVAQHVLNVGRIDIETCEIGSWYVQVLDPYGFRNAAGTFPEEADCVGRDTFVCSADSDGWIWEGDLPAEKLGALRAGIKRESADGGIDELPF